MLEEAAEWERPYVKPVKSLGPTPSLERKKGLLKKNVFFLIGQNHFYFAGFPLFTEL